MVYCIQWPSSIVQCDQFLEAHLVCLSRVSGKSLVEVFRVLLFYSFSPGIRFLQLNDSLLEVKSSLKQKYRYLLQ
jgi:hypothetical protein